MGAFDSFTWTHDAPGGAIDTATDGVGSIAYSYDASARLIGHDLSVGDTSYYGVELAFDDADRMTKQTLTREPGFQEFCNGLLRVA